jgi:hypothetical protein
VPTDLATAVPLLVSILGALGVATIISQWFASGKDRRTSRAAVLTELAAVEAARWPSHSGTDVEDITRLRAAIRQLETAALIARLPRRAIVRYVQLSTACLHFTLEEVERYGDPEAAALPQALYDLLLDAAEIVSRVAWSSRATRWLWLSRQLRKLDRAVETIEHKQFEAIIENVERWVR